MRSPQLTYLARDKFHCLKITRSLFASCIANEISARAVLLIIYIAQREDELRYRGPVKLWNSQLQEPLGIRSAKQVIEVRREAMDAGWLAYERTNDRRVGYYFTILPDEYEVGPLGNAPNERSCPGSIGHDHDQVAFLSEKVIQSGKQSGKRSGPQIESENGKPPTPISSPLPELIERLIEGRLADSEIREIQIRSSQLQVNTALDSNFCLLIASVAYCFGIDFCDSLLLVFDSTKKSRRRNPIEKPKQYILKAMENECRKNSCEWSEVSARIDTAKLSRPTQMTPASVKLDEATEIAFRQWWDVYPRKELEEDARKAFAVALIWLRTAERMKAGASEHLLTKTREHVPCLIANGVEKCPLAHEWLGDRRWREDIRH